MTAPVVTLRAMRADEFDAYSEREAADYVESMTGQLPPEAAREKARQDRERFLPDGLATERQRLLVAENDAGETVGFLWLGLAEPRTGTTDVAWLFDIRVEESHRRHGYGRAMLAAAEELARQGGASQLGLNVFGHNRTAIALYESSGYEVTAQQMAKRLV